MYGMRLVSDKFLIFLAKNSGCFLFFAALLISGCGEKTGRTDYSPQVGDFLFQDADCGNFCEAIEKVTQSIGGARFSHVGLVQRRPEGWMVLEANNGMEITPLDSFLQRSLDAKGQPKVMAARLKPDYKPLVPAALEHAERLIGKPYDEWFNLSNDSLYCSELVYFAFKKANGGQDLFPLAPMTFKDPGTGEIFPVWKDYFEKLKCPVPEGQLGLNPGGISRDEKLEVVHWFYEPTPGGATR